MPSSNHHPRLFLALDLSDPQRRALSRLPADAGWPRSPWRWIPAANLHLTVHFLGKQPVEAIAALDRAVLPRLRTAVPIRIRLRGLGMFPPRGRPSVLWAGVGQGHRALVDLVETLREDLARAEFTTEDRPYRPHVTLARARRRKRPKRREWTERIATVEESTFGTCTADRLVLYESRLTPGGAVYTPNTTWRFRGQSDVSPQALGGAR